MDRRAASVLAERVTASIPAKTVAYDVSTRRRLSAEAGPGGARTDRREAGPTGWRLARPIISDGPLVAGIGRAAEPGDGSYANAAGAAELANHCLSPGLDEQFDRPADTVRGLGEPGRGLYAATATRDRLSRS